MLEYAENLKLHITLRSNSVVGLKRFVRSTDGVTIIGAGLAAAGGVFIGILTKVHPRMGWDLLLPLFAAAVLGGIGRPYGAVAGGLAIGLCQELSTYHWFSAEPFVDPGYKPAVAFSVMVIMLIWRPTGLFRGRVF
jgi:branched-subunit amino acid ABC-type transport system permease component